MSLSGLNSSLPPQSGSQTEPSFTKPWAAGFVIVLFCLCFAISALIPAFQSPDEDVHVKRAYLLGHGQIWLSTPAKSPTGGQIDQGLLQLMSQFEGLPFRGEKKLSANELYEAGQSRWQGTTTFHPTSAISHYFPLIYAPQALGLRIGELLDISVLHSYQLAKLFALITACALIYWALCIYPFSLTALGLFVLPMSLFQMGSASLDGIAHAMSLLVIALYLKITQQNSALQGATSRPNDISTWISNWEGVLLALFIALLTSSRMQLLPLLLLLWSCGYLTKQKKYLYYGAAVGIFTLSWILMTITTVVDTKVRTTLKPLEAVGFYLAHPITGLEVLFNTLSNITILKSYATAFIGVLGWLDASLPKFQYGVLGTLLVLLLVLCFTLRPPSLNKHHQKVLLICAIASMAIVFAALLIQWTPHPATVILGVQGRYFFVPALLICVAFTRPFTWPSLFKASPPKTGSVKPWAQKMSLVILVLLSISSLYCTSLLLLGRYYLMPEQNDTSDLRSVWIAPLSQDAKNSITPLVFSAYQTQRPAQLKSISVLIDSDPTKRNQLSTNESLILLLWNTQGQERQIAADIKTTAASGYLTINVPQDAYIKGQLVANQDAELRVKGIQYSNGDQRACIIYELSDGSRRYTPACP